MEPTTALRRTPFYEHHRAAGAKLVEFAGFEMPVRYTGDVREHVAVRTTAGLFDITHMGEFIVRGASATEWLDRMVTNHVGALAVGQALYSPMCRPDGGIVDDLLVYRYADHYMLVVNAAIGIVQELRSKRTLDRLAVLHAPTATVVRGGRSVTVALGEVVTDVVSELLPLARARHQKIERI